MLPSSSGILAEAISIYEISAWTNNFDFLNQICLERMFTVKNRKSEQHHWILLIRISLGIKFHLQYWQFGPNLPKKEQFRSKTKKVNSIIEFCIFELGQPPNFNLKW